MREEKIAIVMLVIAVLVSCDLLTGPSFEEVSQPYLARYGDPDDVSDYGDSVFWTWDLGGEMLTVFFSQDVPGSWSVASEERWHDFAQISQPYLDQYGPAEEVQEYKSADYWTIDWWWWTKGFEVTFLSTSYDDVRGWVVDSTYSFTPIP